MPQLVATIVIIWLFFIVLAYLIEVFFASLAPASIAVVAFALVALVHRCQVSSAIDRQLDRLLHVQEVGGGIRFAAGTPDASTLPGARMALFAATAASCAIGWFAFAHLMGKGWFADVAPSAPPELTQVVAFVMAGLVTATAAPMAWIKICPEELASQRIAARAAWVNRRIDPDSPLLAAWRANAQFRDTLGGERRPLANLMLAAVGAQSLAGSNHFQNLTQQIDRQTETLQTENRRLEGFVAARATLQATFDRVCAEANRVGNQALLRYLDLVARGFTTLGVLAKQEDWGNLETQIQGAKDELDRVLQNVDQLAHDTTKEAQSATPSEAAYDPYAILGVQRSIATGDLRNVIRRLSQIYHPDGKDWVDHDRMVEINRAWQAIKFERGDA